MLCFQIIAVSKDKKCKSFVERRELVIEDVPHPKTAPYIVLPNHLRLSKYSFNIYKNVFFSIFRVSYIVPGGIGLYLLH